MGQIITFPAQASKFGFKRVGRRRCAPENPNQLQLFSRPAATILHFESGLSPFEQALKFDDRNDDRTEDLYRKAIEELDCVADAFCNLGILQSKHGEIAKAFDSFTTCLKNNPRHFEAHYNLGNLYFDADDLRLAQLHYEMAAEIDPAFPNLYFNLALALAVNNQFSGAIAALHSYQRLTPADEARKADELLVNLKKSLTFASPIQSGTGK